MDGVPLFTCDVCGSNQFSAESGFYYCSICNTQSQQGREYGVDEEEQTNRSRSVAQTTVLGKTGRVKKQQQRTAPRVFLSNWEVANKVIRAMTEKLIEIGFPEILRDKVFQLWTTYLLKRDVILRPPDDEADQELRSSVAINEHKGNLRALYNWQQKRKIRKKKKRYTEHTVRGLKRKATKAKRKAFESSYIDTDYAEDLPSSLQKPSTLRSEVKLKLGPHTRAVFRALAPGRGLNPRLPQTLFLKTHAARHILEHELFTLRSVLMLLFVACRQIGCRVVFSDLVRLVHDGTLYVDSAEGLEFEGDDEEMTKSLLCTRTFFSLKTLHPNIVCQQIPDFLMFLGVKRFQLPSFSEFLPKFVHDCSLPLEFELLVSHLNQLCPESDDGSDIRQNETPTHWEYMIEIKITAMITLLLRFLFGLDDYTERHQSRFAAAVNAILDRDKTKAVQAEWSKLFDIEQWFRHLRLRSAFVQDEGLTPMTLLYGKPPNLIRAHDLSLRYLGSESQDVITSDLSPERQQRHQESNNVSTVQAPNTASLRALFHNAALAGNHGPIPEVPDYVSLPYPNLSKVQSFHTATPAVSYPKYDKDLLYELFYTTRLDYVLNPEKYIPLLTKAGYTVTVLPGISPMYQNKLRLKRRQLLLFQPYKLIQTSLEPSASLRFVIEHMRGYVFEQPEGVTVHDCRAQPGVREMLEHLTKLYALRSRNGYLPLS